MSDEIIETEFELNDPLFIPAGDGKPAQWKPKGDIGLGEFERHMEWAQAELELQRKRLDRYGELIAKARGDGALPRAEHDELEAIQRTLDAQNREQERRQRAIDADIAAGRFFRLRAK
jgi:hypothetical protein